MAATGYTPIQLYRSATASAAPVAANLSVGELAINYTDGVLYYKDNSGVVKILAKQSGITGSGTTNYVSKFTSSSVIGSGVIYDDGTNVGIGTSNPLSKLAVATGGVTIGGFEPGAGSTLELGFDGVEAIVQGYNRTTLNYLPVWIESNYTRFGTDGAERMRIDSSGNVGVGITNPANLLDIGNHYTGNPLSAKGIRIASEALGTATDQYSTRYYFGIDSGGIPYGQLMGPKDASGWLAFTTGSSDTERMRIDSSGNVGIGTGGAPAFRLHVVKYGDTPIVAEDSQHATRGALGADANGGYCGSFTNHAFVFYTNTTERMRLTASGRLGINSSAPVAALQVGGSFGSSNVGMGPLGDLTNMANPRGYYGINCCFDDTTGIFQSTSDGANNGSAIIWATVGGRLNFTTNPSTGNSTQTLSSTDIANNVRMTIDSSGNVGIGVAPTQLLDVNGVVRSRGIGYESFTAHPDTDSSAVGFSTRTSAGVACALFGTYGNSYSAGTYFNVGPGGTTLVQLNSAPLGIGTYGVAQPITFNTNSAERMRIDSSGNLIMDSTNGGYIRPTAGSGDKGIIFPADPGGGGGDIASIKYYSTGVDTTKLVIKVENDGDAINHDDLELGAAASIILCTGYTHSATPAYTERMRIDTTGNVGIGISPSTSWTTADSLKAIQFGPVGALTSLNAGSYNRQVNLYNNAIYDGTNFKHILNDYASAYQQVAGGHLWYTTYTTGSAGTNIAFDTSMGLSSSGNLTIGYNGIDQGYQLAVENAAFIDNMYVGKGGSSSSVTNVAIGYSASASLASGSYNVAAGYAAGANNDGGNNVFIGAQAAVDQANISESVVIGKAAGTGANDPTGLIAIGVNSGYFCSSYSIAIGQEALAGNLLGFTPSGLSNIAIGHNAMAGGMEGDNNIAIGENALYPVTGTVTGTGNICIGTGAGSQIHNGSYNVVIGNDSGSGITGLDDNIIIASGSGQRALYLSDTSYLKLYTSNTERFVINPSGAVSIYNLVGTGTRTVTVNSAGQLGVSSDASLKQEVTNVSLPGLAEIMQVQPRAYKWLSDIEIRGADAAIEIGFFANEVAPIIPSAAPKCEDGLYGFYDRSIIAALVKAVQEQQVTIQSLTARIEQLESSGN